jgi:hypothetical protein
MSVVVSQAPNELRNFEAVLAGIPRGIYCLQLFNMRSNREIHRLEGSARLANVSQRHTHSIMRVCHAPNDFVPSHNFFPFHTFYQFLLLRKVLLIRRRINAVTLEGIDTGLDRLSGASLTLFKSYKYTLIYIL